MHACCGIKEGILQELSWSKLYIVPKVMTRRINLRCCRDTEVYLLGVKPASCRALSRGKCLEFILELADKRGAFDIFVVSLYLT